ncbi:cyclopropane-fatty-acyl-phospholipid synthase family protein [Comamonas thiooxydans]|uniref:cyclopropane-fatty-acyl-phospholipid synthase n=1 Tax=Comamonas thiooxydans TaxID=363952 RepID=UPI00244A294C|nr:cyclopropane-fatty-acyl-phospholipid synthase [Comamonas thiooxydans]MDH1255318.1 cyclopropane-fatty-acyl-phospholipid synthase family protein [Comamonas thiooxydans]
MVFMKNLLSTLEPLLARLPVTASIQLPSGERIGPEHSAVQLIFRSPKAVAALLDGQIGSIGSAIVEGWVEVKGSSRDIMGAAAGLLRGDPVSRTPSWLGQTVSKARSLAMHTLTRDAEQIQFHYDLSDDFYALWLDPRCVYSCAYYKEQGMSLAQAQEAKLDHICKKLKLQPGERFWDIGSGWGGLIFWAAEHYGVQAHGITLSRNQFDHVQRLIAEKGLQGKVQVELRDYRQMGDVAPFDKIGSVGMFEHVGSANLQEYFETIYSMLRPGGLALVHGITAGGVSNVELGAGMGEFINRYIFPGGELMHVSRVLHDLAASGLEMVDTENLRPHYARTLWAWSDGLEARLGEAQIILQAQYDEEKAAKALRAYRLYLAGSAMGFEHGWIALHQMLCSKPDGDLRSGAMAGAQSGYPFNREYIYR